jgi:multimeric flavodoxin WrbA
MKVLAIYGSPRKDGNSARMLDHLIEFLPEQAEIKRLYLSEKNFSGCCASRDCKQLGYCPIQDDMQEIYPLLEWAEVIIFATSTQFADVSADIKKLMERTWWMKGKLKNKIGAAVISGRRYMESVINTLNAFMLRQKMILGATPALGYTFTEMGTIDSDPLALEDSRKLALRITEIYELIKQ